ncbi:MAG: DUF1453 family protein [Candidatus Eremiobacteraeota bacterium]|nr:DUF1453 family protein [Candidatus Eremiobacteraeota bacterium]
MHAPAQPPFTDTIGIYVVVAALLIWRNSRPQKISVTRLWLAPIILLAISAFSIYGSQLMSPLLAWQIALTVIIGVLLGMPLGWVRGHHSNVRLTDRRGVMFVDPSLVVMLVWLAAFVIRAALRYFVREGSGAAILGDGLLCFAISALVTSYYFIYAKYKALAGAAAFETPAATQR